MPPAFAALLHFSHHMGVGGALLLPPALPERPWVALAHTPVTAWVGLAHLVVTNTLLAYLWWNMGIQRVGAGRTATFLNLVPPFGVLIAWLVLGESLTALQLLGGGLYLAGVWVCQRGSRAHEARCAGGRGDGAQRRPGFLLPGTCAPACVTGGVQRPGRRAPTHA
jgi:drug/metabolite transporter (DMT)-like permease